MRYFIGFLVTVGLIILLIILLFHGGGGKSKVPTTTKTLESYASTNAVVKLTIDGPIVAPQNHNRVVITVSSDVAQYEQMQGYDEQVTNTSSSSNSQTSYSAFLHALDHLGFTKGNSDSALKDEGGYCPNGNRYVFELQQDGKDLERYWGTSCGGTKTYLGNQGMTIELFQNQIPNYNTLTQNLDI